MGWDWEKLKRNQMEEYQKKKGQPPANINVLVVGVGMAFLLFTILMFSSLRATSENTIDVLTTVQAFIEEKDAIIRELAIAHQADPRTHAILKKHHIKLGADNELYYIPTEPGYEDYPGRGSQ